jgi:filamentous hemagglutinin family protein
MFYLVRKIPIVVSLAITYSLLSSAAIAQPISDGTTNTQITPSLTINGIPSDRVDAGTLRGSNLFHSFTSFDVANNRGVYFSNPTGIASIFARVTGGNLSNIRGRLGVLGNANLFLINPNGIVLTPNASLDVAGSLFLTSADRIQFADGSTFSAVSPEPQSVLTSSVPIGLGFGRNAGNVQSNALESQFTTPFAIVPRSGGDLLFINGLLSTPSGKIQQGNGNNTVGIILNTSTTSNTNSSTFVNGLGTRGLNLFLGGQLLLFSGSINSDGGNDASRIDALIKSTLISRANQNFNVSEYLQNALLLFDFESARIRVTNSCMAMRNATQGTFVVTGLGGLPSNPYNRFIGEYYLTRIQKLPEIPPNSKLENDPNKRSLSPTWQWRPGDPIVEIRGLASNENGEILPVITYADVVALGCQSEVRTKIYSKNN